MYKNEIHKTILKKISKVPSHKKSQKSHVTNCISSVLGSANPRRYGFSSSSVTEPKVAQLNGLWVISQCP